VSDDVQVVEPVQQAASRPEPARRRSVLILLRDTFLQRREASVVIVAVALMGYFEYNRPIFLSQSNLLNIAQATAPNAIVATGIVLLLISGEIDLSVGMTFALAPFLMHYFADF
jgi:simple sugar transport system permease protein